MNTDSPISTPDCPADPNSPPSAPPNLTSPVSPQLQSEGGSTPNSVFQPSTFNQRPAPFPRSPGETPRAYSAFIAFFQLGHSRTLQAVADNLDEGLSTVKKWSAKFAWADRIQSFNSGLLQQQAEAEAAAQRQQAADWAKRVNEFREQEWNAAQKLLVAAQCFLESFGDEELHKMTLAQVSRALHISSRIGRLALAGAELPEKTEPAMSPIQLQLTAALERMYGKPAAPLKTEN